MRFSRLGVIVFLGALVAVSTGCEAYNRILSRKDVVDGSTAYKERKFAEAERLFRLAAARDPEGKTEEGRIAQLFLARTIHSMYIGDRQNKPLAEKAIEEYARQTHAIRFATIGHPDYREQARREHHGMIAALAKGDRATLVKAFRAHLEPARDAYLAQIGEAPARKAGTRRP